MPANNFLWLHTIFVFFPPDKKMRKSFAAYFQSAKGKRHVSVRKPQTSWVPCIVTKQAVYQLKDGWNGHFFMSSANIFMIPHQFWDFLLFFFDFGRKRLSTQPKSAAKRAFLNTKSRFSLKRHSSFAIIQMGLLWPILMPKTFKMWIITFEIFRFFLGL